MFSQRERNCLRRTRFNAALGQDLLAEANVRADQGAIFVATKLYLFAKTLSEHGRQELPDKPLQWATSRAETYPRPLSNVAGRPLHSLHCVDQLDEKINLRKQVYVAQRVNRPHSANDSKIIIVGP